MLNLLSMCYFLRKKGVKCVFLLQLGCNSGEGGEGEKKREGQIKKYEMSWCEEMEEVYGNSGGEEVKRRRFGITSFVLCSFSFVTTGKCADSWGVRSLSLYLSLSPPLLQGRCESKQDTLGLLPLSTVSIAPLTPLRPAASLFSSSAHLVSLSAEITHVSAVSTTIPSLKLPICLLRRIAHFQAILNEW